MSEAEHTAVDTGQLPLVEYDVLGPVGMHESFVDLEDDGFGAGTIRSNDDWMHVSDNQPASFFIGSDLSESSNHDEGSDAESHHVVQDDDYFEHERSCHDAMTTVEVLPVSVRYQLDDDIANMSMYAERSRTLPPLLWERGFAGRVLFGSRENHTWPYVPPPQCIMQFSAIPIPVQQAKSVHPRLPFAVRRLKFAQSVPDPDVLRNRALVKWRIILEIDLNCSKLGKQLVDLCNDLRAEEELVQVLSDVFSPKSTATLYKRSSAIFKYLVWYKNTFMTSHLVLDFAEPKLYQYLRHLRDSGSAPTSLEAFRQSIAFAIGLIGLQGISHDELGGRIKGICHSSFVKKRVLKQANPLSVIMVESLESIVHSENYVLSDRVFAGHCLFALLASARFSDTQYLQNLKLQTDSSGNGLVEAGTLKHKSGLSKEDKTRLLPYMALASLFSEHPWATHWMMVRDEAGLKPGHQPVMPAIDAAGVWLGRPLTAGEASSWLKDLLVQVGFPLEDLRDISSHSLKSTVLSWAARWGMSLEERRLLGHHLDPQFKSVVTYSREALLKSHVKLQTMMWEIKQKIFDPDQTRLQVLLGARQSFPSGVTMASASNMSDSLMPEAAPDEQLDEVLEAVLDDGYQSVAGSDDLSDHELDSVEQESVEVWSHLSPEDRAVVRVECDMTSYQHKSSGILHFCRDADSFLCGRFLSSNFKPTVLRDIQAWPLCGQCKLSATAAGHTIRQTL